MQRLRKNNQGFTIIEVLIVLAIAGLILLIVFLAVPALQRNSRNTQRKNDVAAAGAAITEYVNNNNGQLPATCSGAASGCAAWSANAKLGLYDAATANFSFTRNAAASAPAGVSDASVLRLYSNSKCNNNDSTTAGANPRSLIALYSVETGGGFGIQNQCQEL
jgi:prepilin-type N-terminal cleavage/methylation domain-containing protein